MKELQRLAAVVAVAAFVGLVGSLALLYERSRLAGEVRDLDQVLTLIAQLGPPGDLGVRARALDGRRRRAAARLEAARAGVAPFTRRLPALLAELELDLLATSGWAPVGRSEGEQEPDQRARERREEEGPTWPPGVAVLERELTVQGPLGPVLDAVHSLESWPDAPRCRALRIVPAGAGVVRATLTLALATGEPAQVGAPDAPGESESEREGPRPRGRAEEAVK